MLTEQIKIANQRAKEKKGEKYGVQFSYEINGKRSLDITRYGMKTIQDLMNYVNQQEAEQNLRPFDSQQNLLGFSMNLASVKQIFIFPVNEENMVYLHILGKQASLSFFVNTKQTTVCDAINLFNKDEECIEKIDNPLLYEIQGKQIKDDMMNKYLSEYITGQEGCIRQYYI